MTAFCARCQKAFVARPGDEHGPIWLLVEHYHRVHGVPRVVYLEAA